VDAAELRFRRRPRSARKQRVAPYLADIEGNSS